MLSEEAMPCLELRSSSAGVILPVHTGAACVAAHVAAVLTGRGAESVLLCHMLTAAQDQPACQLQPTQSCAVMLRQVGVYQVMGSCHVVFAGPIVCRSQPKLGCAGQDAPLQKREKRKKRGFRGGPAELSVERLYQEHGHAPV